MIFVTRLKTAIRYEIVERRPVMSGKGIVSDDVIRLTSRQSRKDYPETLRLVTLVTTEGKRLEFLTNNMKLAASTIADIYKDRWEIEVFFKQLKQNLRIKSFVGVSANAVWTQIWTALIAMLLIRFLQLKARFGWSFSNLVYFLRMNLLVYRDLWEWLHNPFPSEPSVGTPSQLHLGWT